MSYEDSTPPSPTNAYPGLGEVPPKPIGLGELNTGDAPTVPPRAVGHIPPGTPSQLGATTGIGTFPPNAAKPASTVLPISLGIAAAAFLGLSGFQYNQISGFKQSASEAEAEAKTAVTSQKDLKDKNSTLTKEKGEAEKAAKEAVATAESERDKANEKMKENQVAMEQQAQQVQDLQKQLDETKGKLSQQAELAAELETLKEENKTFEEKARTAAAELDQIKATAATPRNVAPAPEILGVVKPRSIKPLVEGTEMTREPAARFGLAWVRLGKYENGPNRGRWYFVAPDGFTSALFPNRELAVMAAESRAGVVQSIGMSLIGSNSNK